MISIPKNISLFSRWNIFVLFITIVCSQNQQQNLRAKIRSPSNIQNIKIVPDANLEPIPQLKRSNNVFLSNSQEKIPIKPVDLKCKYNISAFEVSYSELNRLGCSVHYQVHKFDRPPQFENFLDNIRLHPDLLFPAMKRVCERLDAPIIPDFLESGVNVQISSFVLKLIWDGFKGPDNSTAQQIFKIMEKRIEIIFVDIFLHLKLATGELCYYDLYKYVYIDRKISNAEIFLGTMIKGKIASI